MVIRKKARNKKSNKSNSIFRRILLYFSRYQNLLAIMCVAITIVSALGIVPPILIKNIIDIALPKGNLQLLIYFILLYFSTLLITNLITVGQNYINSLITKRIVRDLRY